jgi:hypothetical protein
MNAAIVKARLTPALQLPQRWRIPIVAAAAVLGWLLLRFALGYPPGAFPWAGDNHVGPGAPSELVVDHNGSYDGLYVYRLTIEPFTTHANGYGIQLDLPGYRQQRIMTALLAHIVQMAPWISPALAIIVVNGIAIVVAIVAGVGLAGQIGRGTAAGVLLALPACIPVSVAADLTEPVAWAGVLCGIWAARRGRWMWSSVAFTVAVLARETTSVVVAGYVLYSLTRLVKPAGREQAARLWLALPVVVETAWQLRLLAVWGKLPALTGFSNTVVAQHGQPANHVVGLSHYPVVGIVHTFLNGFVAGDDSRPAIGFTYVVERCVLVALIGTAGWLLISRRVKIGPELTIAWGFAAALALSMSGWVDDIQFLRPTMEVWGLSVFAILQTRYRWSSILLRSVAVVLVWSGLFALIRS